MTVRSLFPSASQTKLVGGAVSFPHARRVNQPAVPVPLALFIADDILASVLPSPNRCSPKPDTKNWFSM